MKQNYYTIHWWNNKYYLKSGKCSLCKEKKKTVWALIHGKEHKKGIENYIELCQKCHLGYDITDKWVKKKLKSLSKTYSHKHPIKDICCENCGIWFKPAKKTIRFCSNQCSGMWRFNNKVGLWLELNKK